MIFLVSIGLIYLAVPILIVVCIYEFVKTVSLKKNRQILLGGKMNNQRVRCPNCDVVIEVEPGITSFLCPQCESNISIEVPSDNDRIKYPSSGEINRKRNVSADKPKGNLGKTIGIILAAVLLVGIGYYLGRFSQGIDQSILNVTNTEVSPFEISMPYDLSDFKGMKYQDVVRILKSAGFNNITVIAEEVKNNIIHHRNNDNIKEIEIDGLKKNFKKGNKYLDNCKIVITYYRLIN